MKKAHTNPFSKGTLLVGGEDLYSEVYRNMWLTAVHENTAGGKKPHLLITTSVVTYCMTNSAFIYYYDLYLVLTSKTPN